MCYREVSCRLNWCCWCETRWNCGRKGDSERDIEQKTHVMNGAEDGRVVDSAVSLITLLCNNASRRIVVR
jgi:hypothetical protein